MTKHLVCSALGFLYTPPHKVLPFLFLGFGIDDMFVIVQCWNNLTPQVQQQPDFYTLFCTFVKKIAAIRGNKLKHSVPYCVYSRGAAKSYSTVGRKNQRLLFLGHCSFMCLMCFVISNSFEIASKIWRGKARCSFCKLELRAVVLSGEGGYISL